MYKFISSIFAPAGDKHRTLRHLGSLTSRIWLGCALVLALGMFACSDDPEPANQDTSSTDTGETDTNEPDATEDTTEDSSDDSSEDTGDMSTDSGSDADEEFQLDGAVHKGPFVLGSSITISQLDRTSNQPTGRVFNTSTTSHAGEFTSLLPTRDPVLIEGIGFFHNEVTGSLSEANLTLRAYFDPRSVSGTSAAYVNLITHLSSARVRTLFGASCDYECAIEQAEADLIAALGIGPDGFALSSAGTAVNLLSDDSADNAYGLAVSVILIQAAIAEDGPLGAELQEMINLIETDLGDDGELNGAAAAIPALLVAAEAAINPVEIRSNLIARLDEIGSTETPPDLDAVLDSDNDGIANSSDACPFVAADTRGVNHEDADSDGVGDECDYSFSMIAMSGNDVCALHADGSRNADGSRATEGTLMCWYVEAGAPSPYHRNFDATAASNPPPASIASNVYEEVDLGGGWGCARTAAGAVDCWTRDGLRTAPSGATFSTVRGAGSEACGIRTDAGSEGDILCWNDEISVDIVGDFSAIALTISGDQPSVCAVTGQPGSASCYTPRLATQSRSLPSPR